jgi:lactate permease
MQYLLAASPILLLLALMTLLRWSGQRAGPASWLAALLIAAFFFGLTPQILWISQAKGLLFSFYVLAVLWPALLMYNLVNQIGGIRALTQGLENTIGDRGLLLVLLAWAFSAILEGLAGFGLPIAVTAPMLVGLGIEPFTAVLAVAVGHTWSVTFGNMGMVFQTLVSLSGIDGARLVPPAALMMGVACLACGLCSAWILGQGKRWPAVLGLAIVMSLVQFGLAFAGLAPLSAFGGALAGLFCGIIFTKRGKTPAAATATPSLPLAAALGCYGLLALLMALLAFPGPIHDALYPIIWRVPFPETATLKGFVTPAGYGQAFRPWVYPGSIILVTIALSAVVFRRLGLNHNGSLRAAAADTWRSAAPATIGVITTVGLSSLMEHCGMTLLLAQGLSRAVGAAFPIFSPLVGMLGAFATGSNTNSNALFVSLQKNIALLLSISPVLLISTQTAGGSLGSMISPAKLIIGCSTVGLKGREGEVLRRSLPYGLGIGLLVGLLAMGLVFLQR